MREQLKAETIADLEQIVAQLTPLVKRYKKVAFVGEIGAGKTTFIKVLCNSIGVEGNTSSPTYSIIKDKLQVVKKLKKTSFVLSKDIGIISYNETPLKEIIKDGITTISTDFNFMGERLAQMIVNNEKTSIENPSKIIIRNSL